MEDSELHKNHEYLTLSYTYRGKFIDRFNRLEKSIEKYLIKYFQLPKENDNVFSNVVLDRLTFQSKKEAFSSILNKKAVAAGFIKTNNNKYPHGQLIKNITELQDERNAFAHYYLVTPDDFNEICVVLAEFRDSPVVHEYTLYDYHDLIVKMNKTTEEIRDLIKELPERFPH